MSAWHMVRFGALAHVGSFAAADAARYPRGARVVLRTARGLEIGEVLSVCPPPAGEGAVEGAILRRMSVEDELLAARLERHRLRALEACAEEVARRQLPLVLVDVEHLFDGGGLVFYFLGDSTRDDVGLDRLTATLAETYETKVQFRRFAETLEAGCGPGCGTAERGGCGESCGSCAVSGACGAPRAAHERSVTPKPSA